VDMDGATAACQIEADYATDISFPLTTHETLTPLCEILYLRHPT